MKKYELCAFTDEAGSSLADQIKAMKDNELNYMEIRNVDSQNVSLFTEEKAKDIYKRLEAEGLKVWSVGSPIGKITLEDDFAAHLDLFKHCLDLAHTMQAPNIRLFSFYLPQGLSAEDKKNYEDPVLERMSAIRDAAKGSGVNLCLENEKGLFGDDAPSCLFLHQALPEYKSIFDPANFVQCGQDTLEAYELLHPYIHYMHIKDALESGHIVPPGKGIGNLKALLEKFGPGQGKVLSVEPHLAIFDGLSDLEEDPDNLISKKYVYSTQREAFDTAVNSLKEILDEI